MQSRMILLAFFVCLIGLWGCSGNSGEGDTATTDDTGTATPGDGQSGDGQSGDGQSGDGQPSDSSPAATTSLDLSYVSDDFGLAVILRPAAMLGTDLAAQLPTDMVFDEMTKETGFVPHDLDQVVFLLALPEGFEKIFDMSSDMGDVRAEPPEAIVEEIELDELEDAESDEPFDETDMESDEEFDLESEEEFDPGFDEEFDFEPPPEPIVGIIMRSQKAFDKQKILESAMGSDVPEPVEHDGMKYYKNEYDPSFYFPDEKTLVMGTTAVLPSMMSAKNVDSPLVRQLKTTDVDHDAVLVAVAEPFQETLAKILETGGFPPPLKAAMQTVLNNAAAVTASVDITGDPLLCVTLQGKDDAAAGNLDAFVKTSFETGKQMFTDMKDKMAAEVPMGLGGPLATVAEQIVAGISIEKKDMEVAVVLKRPAALDGLPEQLKPAVDAAREQAKMNNRMNKLRMLSMGMMEHQFEHEAYPPHAIYGDDKTPLLSWRVSILPLLGHEDLYERFKLDESWDSPHNIELLKEMPDYFAFESDTQDGKTRIMVFTGEGAPFDGAEGLKDDDITDGTSNTILLVEAGPDRAVPWTKPEDLPFDRDDPLKALGTISETGFPAVFFDGHVLMLLPNADLLEAMITPAGGEIVEE